MRLQEEQNVTFRSGFMQFVFVTAGKTLGYTIKCMLQNLKLIKVNELIREINRSGPSPSLLLWVCLHLVVKVKLLQLLINGSSLLPSDVSFCSLQHQTKLRKPKNSSPGSLKFCQNVTTHHNSNHCSAFQSLPT